MYRSAAGDEYFVVDAHLHYWDASPANQKNKYGAGFISCFYDYHSGLSPAEYVWPREKYEKYDQDTMMQDLFVDGYDDIGILQSTYLSDFYVNGFNTTERNAIMKEKHPDRFILNSAWDPREEEAGLAAFEEKVEKYGIKGVKLYTASWHGDSHGWSLKDPWAEKYLEKCVELGVKNIHVHKGPTIWPLDKDAFDVADIDYAATAFTDLNFIVEHVGMPRIEDFCWIAVQEPNVYGGLAVLMPFIHPRPKYFGDVMARAALLARRGPAALLLRLRPLAPQVADREVRRLRPARADDRRDRRLAVGRGQAEDPGAQRLQALRHRPRRARGAPEGGRVRPEGGDRARPAGRGRAGRGGLGMTVSVDAVWEAIDGVIDPELDRSLVELEFVRSVEVGEGDVHVALRLPTYWCSPNFAYLMVGDAHEAVRRVPGAERVRVDLVDHYAGERISDGDPGGPSFQEAFPDQAEGELHELRRKFRLKAFVVRQEPVLRAVRHTLGDGGAVALRLGDGTPPEGVDADGVVGVPAPAPRPGHGARGRPSWSSPTPRARPSRPGGSTRTCASRARCGSACSRTPSSAPACSPRGTRARTGWRAGSSGRWWHEGGRAPGVRRGAQYRERPVARDHRARRT